ncbi:unnamed protein product [Durusdinium trenchii]|uniref:Uncharacterized protein n=1 Tax=Durusdinium trenchii TaxID=1381693 RepID=A0ABP0SXW5_9DINO
MKPLWLVSTATIVVVLQASTYFLPSGISLGQVVLATVVLSVLLFWIPKTWIQSLQKHFSSKEVPLLTSTPEPFSEEAPSRLREEALERRPKPRHQLRLARSAQEVVTSWVAVLMAGVDLVVNRQLMLVRAEPPLLLLGNEEVQIAEISIQLQGPVITVLSQGVKWSIDCEESSALQLALSLKVLRAEASGKWKERPLDHLCRPRPAE